MWLPFFLMIAASFKIENFNRFDYSIVELNDNPGIGICECPYEGKGQPIGEYILRLLGFIK